MKKILTAFVAVAAILTASNAFAGGDKVNSETGQYYGQAGCGLGSLLFGNKEGMVQVLAATTNGTYCNQTFGISSGTSNCENRKTTAENLNLYVEVNRVAVANDIARGSGETLADISETLGCSDSETLGKTLQKNYSNIFPTEDVSSHEISRSILQVANCSS